VSTVGEDELVVGADTHKDVHVAVLLDRLGRRLAVASFPATDAGNQQLWCWAAGFGTLVAAGVEGTGSYGHRLARALAGHGVQVWEVNRPDRARRRRRGKSDPVDAENAARAVLASEATAVPKDRRGVVGQLRALLVTRRSAVKARTQAFNQIHGLLIEADDELRAQLATLRKARFARACADLDQRANLANTEGIRRALASLGRRWLALNTEATDLEAQITALIRRHAPKLLARRGVGALSAAQLLVTAGANPTRLHSSAAFAALCGASPVDASSGKTTRRRLNRGGDRAANSALWMIAHVRLVHDPRSRDYAAKRTAAGNSRKEIIRLLKRYIARELFPLIIEALTPPDARTATTA
jgi:transposase